PGPHADQRSNPDHRRPDAEQGEAPTFERPAGGEQERQHRHGPEEQRPADPEPVGDVVVGGGEETDAPTPAEERPGGDRYGEDGAGDHGLASAAGAGRLG